MRHQNALFGPNVCFFNIISYVILTSCSYMTCPPSPTTHSRALTTHQNALFGPKVCFFYVIFFYCFFLISHFYLVSLISINIYFLINIIYFQLISIVHI